MKITRYIVAFTLLASGSVFAQKAPIRLGDVPMEDMRMTVYPKDTSADAVVLADYGTTEIKFNENTNYWEVVFERIYRLKILNKDGLMHAGFHIPWLPPTDVEERMKITTYNLVNGKVVDTKSDRDSFFEDQHNGNFVLSRFALTNVRAGTVIEISYRKTTNSAFTLPQWEFQSTIPVRFSEYRTVIPEYFGYGKDMLGYIPLTVDETSGRTATYRYSTSANSKVGPQSFELNGTTQTYSIQASRMVATDVPAFKAEPFITTPGDHISRVIYDLAYIKYLYITCDALRGKNVPID